MIEPTQADREAAADYADVHIRMLGLAEKYRNGRRDDDLVQAIARARIEGAERMREAAERVAKGRRSMWSCAGGFEGHTSGANVIANEIAALSPADVVKVPGSPPT